ncbi:hypothetical protein Tco_1452092, partial [Tanacetum coccineum]
SSPTTSIPEIPTAPILPAPSAIVAPSFEFPLAPVVPPEIHRRRAILILPREDIPITLRYTSPHLDHFTSRSSSSYLSSDHSSFGHSILGHSLSIHTPPDTTDADSSTPLRFGHSLLARTPRCSEAYLYWRSAPLSTMYPLTTSESSVGDSSSELFARPSRKRCRFRDSISLEDSVEEDIDRDVLEVIEADATAVEVAVDKDVEAGINAGIGIEVDVRVDVKDKVEDEVESDDRGTIEVVMDVVARIDIPDAMLMPDAVERLEQVEDGLEDIYDHAIKELVNRRVEEALAAYEATRAANALEAKSQSQNGSDGDNGNGGNRNGGDGNGGNGNGGNGNPVDRNNA